MYAVKINHLRRNKKKQMKTTSTNDKQEIPLLYSFIIKIIIQSFVFIGALSVRDTLRTTLDLIPIPQTNIWWRWVQTILHLFVVIIVIWCLLKTEMVHKSVILKS